jgi:hypothetical protein
MSELEDEQRHLAAAERHLKEGELRIAQQKKRLEGLPPRGMVRDQAQELLRTLEATLVQWQAHRRSILERIRVIKDENKGP